MNMYLHELRVYRKSTIIWTLAQMSLVVLFLAIFPSFASDAQAFKEMLEGFPEELRKAIGLSVDSIATVIGFYSYIFLYLKLCGAIQAMNLGTSLVSKETSEKTADFLLTKPVTRYQILSAKLLAAFTSLIVTNVFFIGTTIMMAIFVSEKEFNVTVLFLIAVSLFLMQLIFLSIGVIVSVVFPKIKSVISVSLGTVFGFFMVAMVSSAMDDTALRYITPFNYFNTSYIIENASYEGSFLLVGGLIIVAAISASFYIYHKRDVHTV
ncbi:ABC transporter permease subunit [Bacillus luteolus]|uniref:ABC transporter permease subunit n=1 Tax=Litchfieldia luteola TaxID=682179 RepID=A0ABR9QQ80_9BACI|nr:ABC transporter permease subunit [Cytobacillus luteolus]MBE4910663.1 ABC transporter permease subunit [Cytobacillus luteolus]MBP1943842.1 ABC-2 type transport system permease protein [Cytobacillus luteolus]